MAKFITPSNCSSGVLLGDHNNEEIASVYFVIDAGSVYEEDRVRGIAHLLEHSAFNGAGGHTRLDIEHEFENLLATYNATTSKQIITFFADCPTYNVEKLYNLLYDIVFNPDFPESAFEKEKQIVRQELDMYLDDDWSVVMDDNAATMNSVYKHPIVGYTHTLDNISNNDLKEYHEKFFTKERTRLYISGKIPETLVERIQKDFPIYHDYVDNRLPNIINPFPPVTKSVKDNLNQAKLCCYLPFESKYYLEYQVISYLFGGSTTSILFQQLRENEKLCYQVGSYLDFYPETSNLVAFISFSDFSQQDYLRERMYSLLAEIQDVPEERVELAKQHVLHDYVKGLCNPFGQVSTFNSLLRKGLPTELHELSAKAEKITKESLTEILYNNPYYKQGYLYSSFYINE